MKANAPEKLYLQSNSIAEAGKRKLTLYKVSNDDIKYVRADAFIEKAKKWFEKHNEWFDPNGVRHCDLEDFEDFRKYMEGEKKR